MKGNLLGTPEGCLEWHLWYEYEGEQWQIDMIHIVRGSRYDGYFERVAERIKAVLTPAWCETILRLKYETPEEEKIMGIEYCQAVIRDGVCSYDELMQWRARQPGGIIEWMP